MFLGLRPLVAVVTNVEHDHPDIYPTEADYLDAFARFIDLLPADGLFVGCSDDPQTRALMEADGVISEAEIVFCTEPVGRPSRPLNRR